jgi:hypothetical protein
MRVISLIQRGIEGVMRLCGAKQRDIDLRRLRRAIDRNRRRIGYLCYTFERKHAAAYYAEIDWLNDKIDRQLAWERVLESRAKKKKKGNGKYASRAASKPRT